LIDSKSCDFHYPEFSCQRFGGKTSDQGADKLIEQAGSGLRWKTQHGDTREIFWFVLKWIGEVEVKTDECPHL